MVLGYQNVAEVRHLALLLVKRPVSLAMLAAIRLVVRLKRAVD